MQSAKGFTLIELLVVIGILGILAAALVATLDPFEQLKKAQDANVKNIAVEFVEASTRYYTTHNAMMWGDDTSCATLAGPVTMSLTDSKAVPCLTDLVNDGEIKAGFTTATNALQYIIITGSSNSVTACFQPQSKSGARDANAKYTIGGVETTGCAGQPGGSLTTCYWCSL